MSEQISTNNKNQFVNIVTVQAVFVIIILISVIISKYFFKDIYTEMKKFYKEQICSETHISEVIGETDEI